MTCGSFGDWSDSGYCTKAYDQLYVRQTGAVNPVERLRLADQMQQMVYEDRPYIVLVYNETLDAWSNSWTGFVQSVQGLFPSLSKASLSSVHQV